MTYSLADHLTAIFQGLQQGILVIDSENNISLWNAALLSIFRLSTAADLQQFWQQLTRENHQRSEQQISADDRQLLTALRPIWNQIQARQTIQNVVVQGILPNSSIPVSLLVNVMPLNGTQPNDPAQVVCTFSDMTARPPTIANHLPAQAQLAAQPQTFPAAAAVKQPHWHLHQAHSPLMNLAQRDRTMAIMLQQMRQSLDLESIFRVTTRELRQAIACDRVIIYRFNPDWSGYITAEAVGEGWQSLLESHTPSASHGSAINSSAISSSAISEERCIVRLLATEAPVIQETYLQETKGGIYAQGVDYLAVDDIYTRDFSHCYIDFLHSLHIRAYITVPIYAGNHLWGLLACYQNDGSRHWHSDEAQMVTQIGAQLGVAMKQAELLQHSQQQAETFKAAKEYVNQVSQAKSAFLASMGHELRTPLNAILGFTQLIHKDTALPHYVQGYIDIIHNSGEQLLNLINNVLEVSKIEAGQLSLQTAPLELVSLLQELQTLMGLKAANKGLTLHVSQAPDVPSSILTDSNKLKQVLLNLLGNAIKFTSTGHINLEVTLRKPLQTPARNTAHPRTMTLEFAIEDTGIGMAATEIDALFSPCQQTKSALKSREEYGLGITISRQYIRLMGGDIAVESTPGQGTRLTFTIATQPIIYPTSAAAPHFHQVVGLAEGQPQYRILMAEDNVVNRLLLKKILKPLALDLREAHDGAEALKLWESWQPHLIWMDLKMPNMDGYEAIRQIRAAERDRGLEPTYIIALTATTLADDQANILATGCDDILSKPYKAAALFEKMEQMLNLKYRYAETTTSQTVMHQSTLGLVQQLAAMDQDWQQALKQAASACNDADIFPLLQQIPKQYLALSECLEELTEIFQFDQILTLLEKANPNSQKSEASPQETTRISGVNDG